MSKKDSKQKNIIKVEQGYICPICGEKGTEGNMNIHHKKAKCRGGTSCRENLVAWHIQCHANYHKKYKTQTSDNYGNPVNDGSRRIIKPKRKRNKSRRRRR